MKPIVYMPCDVHERVDGLEDYSVESVIKFFWGEDALEVGLNDLARSTTDGNNATELVLKPTFLCDVVTHFDDDGAHEFMLLPKGVISKEEWLKLNLPRVRYDDGDE